MSKVTVEPDWFFYTAACLGQAASKLAVAVSRSSSDGGLMYSQKMAGNDARGSGWGTSYDAAAKTVLEGAASLAGAWSSMAQKVHQAGVNHQIYEWEAGRRGYPGPNAAPAQPPISSAVAHTPPSAVGDNGPGLDDFIPGLVEAVGEPCPNGDYEKLGRMAPAWTALGDAVNTSCSEWIAKIHRPDASMVDAVALYDTIMKLNEPANAIAGDAMKLASFTSTFGTAIHTFREQSAKAIDDLVLIIGVIGAAAALGTRIAGKKAIAIGGRLTAREVSQTGKEIGGFIRALEPVVASMRTFVTALNPAMQTLLSQMSIFPAESNELQPDGTWKKTIRYFSLEKWMAWQKYLLRGGDMDIDTWSDMYDRLEKNRDDGAAFDQHAADVMGYSKGTGWIPQFGAHKEDYDKVPVPGRHWDWANPATKELAEHKNGSLDFSQMAIDERVLDETDWTITYNLNANHQYTQKELDELERLEREYPGRFKKNWIN
ncbi:hypothetical protein DDK01_17980 [Mycobacteroides abscessus]|nr:hypothetical protein DDK01_17980 [Mycobacteroides abscessus]